MSDVLILYQISNELPLNNHPTSNTGYNAFYLPRKNNGITLSSIKSHIGTSLGHNQFHWRVRIDDRPAANSHDGHATPTSASSTNSYSWWDIQDENARLPIKEATPKELKKMFAPPKKEEVNDVTQEVTKAAKGAMKYMNKAMTKVAGSHHTHHPSSMHGYDDEFGEDEFGMQRVAVICFKVLDLTRMGRNLTGSSGGSGGVRRVVQRRSSAASTTAAAASQPRVAHRGSVSSRANTAPQQRSRATPAKPSVAAPTANLMDFGSTSTTTAAATPQRQQPQQQHRPLPSRTPSSSSSATGKAHPNETRAEKLKREYAKKNAQSNRVWDEVDQRWVEKSSKNGESAASRTSSASALNNSHSTGGGGVPSVTKSVKGISLSTTNAIGKSANVQAAVHARVAEMEASKQKALTELRNREAAKAQSDAEEDVVRQRLEPKLKAWSEEHGQKKQLRALLANLHTILWEGSGWKQVSLADVLDDGKVKRAYHKASRVVHPDKTLGLDAEKKFVAKRVFDALTQAKVAFDEGKR